jgi:hypothetical protein
MPFEESVLYLDEPGSPSDKKPPFINGYVPDLYATGSRHIVGEAKTKTDLDRVHSRLQIEEFFRFLSTTQNGLLVLAVPLIAWNYGKSVLRCLRRETAASNVEAVCIYGQYARLDSADFLRVGRVA